MQKMLLSFFFNSRCFGQATKNLSVSRASNHAGFESEGYRAYPTISSRKLKPLLTNLQELARRTIIP
jgi:hypothetical protein